MKLAEREQQILLVKSHSFQSEMISELEDALRTEVNLLIKTTIEAALVEELESFRSSRSGFQPRRSGYFHRLLDTQYGRIPDLRVPKLRSENNAREWQILKRYQRGLKSYRAQSWIEARQRLKSFVQKWQNLEAKAVEIFQREA